ncbi:RNA cytosine C(5)-methyltransferase NSUN2 (Myc-induced SUN domain-containing protein) (Misu) (NOL1/NOP2/Sun domain family member 2) (mRNA cytosine C(5)-methyltransferase) (tRNA cytosine C(5)-methyltransferase), partial [Durusdinium trenchii]
MARHGAARNTAARRTAPVETNSLFEEFYQKQQVVGEDSWDEFMTVLQKPMPVVVRLNRTKPHWQELQVSFAMDVRWSELPWFPGAWRCDAKDYDDSLRSQCSALNKSYALRFQEAASLVPPLLLEVKSTDLLLDLCAAPGSKTLECIELMREESDSLEGVVIANDADAERCFELLPLITRKARHPGCAVVLGNGAKYPAQFWGPGDQLL